MSEHEIQQSILIDLGSRPDVRLWRNNSGQAWQGEMRRASDTRIILDNARPVSFGFKGAPDLAGFKSVTITPEMVGKTVAIWLGVEVKGPRGRLTEQQAAFIAMAEKRGALVGVARSVEEARSICK